MIISLPANECLDLLENDISEGPREPIGLTETQVLIPWLSCVEVTQKQLQSDIQWFTISQVSEWPNSSLLCGYAPGHL